MLKEPSAYPYQFANNRQQLHELLMQAPVPIVIYRSPLLIIDLINNKGLEMWNKTRDDVLNKPLFDVFPEAKGNGFEKIFETVYESGKTFSVTEQHAEIMRHGKLESGWFNVAYEPLYEDGKITGIMSVATEVTEQVRARKKIEEREEKYKQLSETLEQEANQRTAQLVDLNKTLGEKNTDLANTQNFLQQLIDASVEFILVLDKDLRHITLNKKFEEAMGFTREEVKGKHLFEINPKAKDTIQHESILKALKGETVYLDKRQAIAKPGYFVDTYFIPLILKDKIEGVIIMSRDVSEIVRSGKILENKNKELNEAQQIALLGSWDWNPHTNEVQWSDQMYRMYGYGEERFPVTFEKAIEKMLPSDAEKAKQRMKENIAEAERLLKEKGQTEFHNPPSEYPIILPDGSKKILRGAGKIIFVDGKVSRVIGTVQDITNQKLIEQELINANKKLEERNQFVEKLINSSLDLIMVVDKELRFLTLNKKAETIINSYYSGNLIGKKITDVNPTLKDTQPYEDILLAFNGEIIIRDKVKSTISDNYYEHNYVPLLNANGEVYAVMIISHDITESINQVEELKKAIAADKLKSDFIKMASHELKTPVTSIKGYSQLLLNALKEEEETKKYLSPLLIKSSLISIDKQISRLTRLMSELLDLSKIETGMLELDKEVFGLNELAIETVQDILYSHSKHTINLFHDFWSRVYGDRDRIGQVLINFLTNAIKYSPASDKIEVWVHQADNKSVSISVKDSGIGIDKKYHEKIFERFYRAEEKEEQTYPGFGIGLFIAKEIIQRHNGYINLKSEKGKGSVFTFTLPVASLQTK